MTTKKFGGFVRKSLIFLIKFIKKILNDDILGLAAQLAYHFVLAFVPFLIFLMTLVGVSNLNSNEVLSFLSNVMPKEAFYLIQNTVVEVVDVQQTGLLWVSIVLAVWTSSSGFQAVIKGLNKSYGVKEKRSYLRLRIASMIYTVLLAITILATLFLLVFGQQIGSMLTSIFHNQSIILYIWNFTRYLIIVAMMMLVFSFLYNVTPCVRLGWGEVVPGAVITTVGWIITSYAFAYYVNTFSNYSRLYGSLGAVFILITWLFISAIILLLGGEVNAVLSKWDK